MSNKFVKVGALLGLCCALPACSTQSSGPKASGGSMSGRGTAIASAAKFPSPRIVKNIDAGWRFKFAPGGSPVAADFDDSGWDALNLPHTWNALDGASTRTATGDGWYRKILTVGNEFAGKKVYLHFEGGCLTTDLFIDGKQIDLNPATPAIDGHHGGFQAFDFDVTSALTPGMHLLAVKVNNATDRNSPPAGGGDYSKLGGLYRDVSLIAVNPTHIALTQTLNHTGLAGSDTPSQISGTGVQFSHTPVVIGSPSTTITVKTTIASAQGSTGNVSVKATLTDASGATKATQTSSQALGAEPAVVSQVMELATPHLWDGRIDPYLYDLNVEVRESTGKLVDSQHQRVGIRSIKINANPNPNDTDPMNRAAFMLNGHPYEVIGADMHQDSGMPDENGRPVGSARSEAQIWHDIDQLVDMGGTGIRTSHYQDNRSFYDYCDEVGVLVYTENSINGRTYDSDPYLMNSQDQYAELILQNLNNASVFAWGFGNETGVDSEGLVKIFTQLNNLGHRLDTSRLTAWAQFGGSISKDDNADSIADIKGTHPYDYWYGGNTDVKATHAAYPKQPLGVTEYGGGASAYQYADQYVLPASTAPGIIRTHFHPANLQTRLEELHFSDLHQLNFLFGLFTWQFFDHASSGKNEGDQGGVNDKGLVTRDRIPKDGYYFYKAVLQDPARSWNNQHVLYISDRFWTVRNKPTTTVTVFSNVGVPMLRLNGDNLGPMTPLVTATGKNGLNPGSPQTIKNTYLMDITLAEGDNDISVQAANDRARTTISYRSKLEGAPVARIDFVGTGQAAAQGYVADDGSAFADHNGTSSGGTAYGWLPATKKILAVGKSFGDAGTDPAANGINFNYDSTFRLSSAWEYALPNGTYDVRIGAGQSGTNDSVNNFAIEGTTATIDSNGHTLPDTFFARVEVKDGKLTLSAAPGAFNARIAYIDINRVTR